MKMTNNYYQKHKERLFLKKEKTKGERRPEKDIRILLKKKKKTSVSSRMV